MKVIVPVSSIKEINMGETVDGQFQIVFEWGDGKGYAYYTDSDESLNYIFENAIEPYLGMPNVAWVFDDTVDIPTVIIR